MNRSTIATTARVGVCLALVGAWFVFAPGEVSAGQMGASDDSPVAALVPATQQANAPQQPQEVAATQDPTRRRSYGARGVLTLLSEDSLKTSLGFSGFSVLPLTTDLEIEGEIGYQAMNTIIDGLPAGRLSMFPFRATLRVQMWRFGGAKPYLGGGGGMYITRFTLDSSVVEELARVGFAGSVNVDPAFSLHASAGVEWQRDRLHFGVDVKYVFGKADVQSNVVDQVSGDVFRETSELKLNGFWIAGGLRFAF